MLFWFASANRDERAFDDPFRVNLARVQNKHLSFGQQGPHVCLGMWLARLEVRVLFQELSKRITSIEASRPHQFLRSNFVGGIKSLPVRLFGVISGSHQQKNNMLQKSMKIDGGLIIIQIKIYLKSKPLISQTMIFWLEDSPVKIIQWQEC